MKKTHSLFYHILIFIVAQVAWLSLLGLWIYWYVSNYIILTKVGSKISPQLISGNTNLFALISGLILMVAISLGMSLIFVYLTRQISLTRMYDNFIASITHELKSPLSSIQLYLETLRSRQIPRDKQQEFFTLMLNDVERLNKLISSILYLSGLDQKKTIGKYAYDYQIYDSDQVLRQMIRDSAEQVHIPDKAIRISGHPSCQCVLDRNWFRLVFDNLFDNAAKYTVQPVQLDIRLNCTRKKILIEITDNGVGIASKDQKKIFHKFQRLEHHNSPSVKGTGLGLYWVNELVRFHGGRIGVFSKGQGYGTTFKIELPVYRVSKKHYIKNLLKRSRKTVPADEKK